MPELAGHSTNWVFWVEFVNAGSPVPAGWTAAAAGWASTAAQRSAPAQRSRVSRMAGEPASALETRHSGLPADVGAVIPADPGVIRLGGAAAAAQDWLKKPFSISRA